MVWGNRITYFYSQGINMKHYNLTLLGPLPMSSYKIFSIPLDNKDHSFTNEKIKDPNIQIICPKPQLNMWKRWISNRSLSESKG